MKLISAAIALLASATIVSSLPVYDSTYSSPTTDWPTSTYNDGGSSPTPSVDYCEGFKITSQTEPEITWAENSKQEVVFDFGTSKVTEVEYVDLVKYDSKEVVDEWATGPWSSSNPRTGLHELHIHRGEPGYYQFLVYAATEDHHHCTYLSGKFTITSDGGSHDHGSYNESSSTYPDEPYSTSAAAAYNHYDEPSSTYSDEPYSTSSVNHNAYGHYDEPSSTYSDEPSSTYSDEPYSTSSADHYNYGHYDETETYSDEPPETYSDEPSPTYYEPSSTYDDYPDSTSTSDEFYPYEP